MKTKEMVLAAKARGAKTRAEAAKKHDEDLRESCGNELRDWTGEEDPSKDIFYFCS